MDKEEKILKNSRRKAMNCPNCGVPLMGGMKVCPKCKYDTRISDGGEAFRQYNEELLRKKEEEKLLASAGASERVKRFSGEHFGKSDVVYHIEGARGRTIDIYPYKCVITTTATIGSVLSSNATDGEKTIYYQDCIGLQLKKPGLTLGFLQFETASPSQNNSGSNFFNENTFTYETTQISAEEMDIVTNYVKTQLDKVKEAQRLSWMKDW